MAQTEMQNKEEAERFRRAKARADLKARIAMGQLVPVNPEELASEEDSLFRSGKGIVDSAARKDMQQKQAKRSQDWRNPPV